MHCDGNRWVHPKPVVVVSASHVVGRGWEWQVEPAELEAHQVHFEP